MRRKAREILHGEQGLSMILVLCIGALFVALSAALVYAASVLTANANRQLLEQEAYQLATSFSDVLEGELNTPSSQFATFVNNTFMTSTAYGNDVYNSQTEAFPFTWKADAATDGAEEITVSLRRRPGDDVDKLNLNGNGQSVTTASGWTNQLAIWEGDDYTLNDLQLDVTVTVKKAGESFSYTVTYDRKAHYKVAYYTIDDLLTQYTWVKDTNKFSSPGSSYGDKEIPTEETKHTIVPHFDLNSLDKTNIRYTRGARQTTAATTRE